MPPTSIHGRKVIQLTLIPAFPSNSGWDHPPVLVALCDDGSVFQQVQPSESWIETNVPQPDEED